MDARADASSKAVVEMVTLHVALSERRGCGVLVIVLEPVRLEHIGVWIALGVLAHRGHVREDDGPLGYEFSFVGVFRRCAMRYT